MWSLAARQHGVVSRQQLEALGMSRAARRHRMKRGRLHPVMRGVYAVGRPELTRHGRWMAAVLYCIGRDRSAGLSHRSAGALWGIAAEEPGKIELSVQSSSRPRAPGIRAHRRRLRSADLTAHVGIPVTVPVRTLVDLATVLSAAALERAVNEADRLDLIDPEALRGALGQHRGERGVATLRTLLDAQTFRMTDSELERRFLGIVDGLGLGRPQTQVFLNGFRVDFFWPDLGLVVECDGLRYHRTPAQQARALLRDQAHVAAGLVPLRFSHAQVYRRPEQVREALRAAVLRRGEDAAA